MVGMQGAKVLNSPPSLIGTRWIQTETHIIGNMKNPSKLVIDTHILVAATRNRHGPSFALVQAIRLGAVRMCCSPALFLELDTPSALPLRTTPP